MVKIGVSKECDYLNIGVYRVFWLGYVEMYSEVYCTLCIYTYGVY